MLLFCLTTHTGSWQEHIILGVKDEQSFNNHPAKKPDTHREENSITHLEAWQHAQCEAASTPLNTLYTTSSPSAKLCTICLETRLYPAPPYPHRGSKDSWSLSSMFIHIVHLSSRESSSQARVCKGLRDWRPSKTLFSLYFTAAISFAVFPGCVWDAHLNQVYKVIQIRTNAALYTVASKVVHRYISQVTSMYSYIWDKHALAMKEFSTGMQQTYTTTFNLTTVPKQKDQLAWPWGCCSWCLCQHKSCLSAIWCLLWHVLLTTYILWICEIMSFLNERRIQPVLLEKQIWAHHQDQALGPASPQPRAFTHVFLHLSFASILNILIYLQKY